jgi:hypothetical protein
MLVRHARVLIQKISSFPVQLNNAALFRFARRLQWTYRLAAAQTDHVSVWWTSNEPMKRDYNRNRMID